MELNNQHTRLPNTIILDGTIAKLIPRALDVYHVLCMFRNYRTNEAHVDYKTIMRYTALSRGRDVRKRLDSLIKHDLIAEVKPGGRRRNQYEIL